MRVKTVTIHMCNITSLSAKTRGLRRKV